VSNYRVKRRADRVIYVSEERRFQPRTFIKRRFRFPGSIRPFGIVLHSPHRPMAPQAQSPRPATQFYIDSPMIGKVDRKLA